MNGTFNMARAGLYPLERILIPVFDIADPNSKYTIKDAKRRFNTPEGSLWVCDGEEDEIDVEETH